jgi:hypothetical protein
MTQATYTEHKAMLAALAAGTATPEQQRAAFAHIEAVRRQHNADLRDAERDSRDAYREGRWDSGAESRGEPYGTY